MKSKPKLRGALRSWVIFTGGILVSGLFALMGIGLFVSVISQEIIIIQSANWGAHNIGEKTVANVLHA